MKNLRRLSILLTVFVLLAGCSVGVYRPPGHLVGYVYIPGGTYVKLAELEEILFSADREPPEGYIPLFGAEVRVGGRYGVTDGSGRFEIWNISPGWRTVTVSHSYLRSPIRRAVLIESDKTTWLGRYEEGPLFGGVGYFLVIGIGKYPGQSEEPPGVVQTAEMVYEELFKKNGLYAFGAKLINTQATKAKIKRQIEEIVDLALVDPNGNSDDYLVIYFAGKSGQDYLSPSDDDLSGWHKAITDAELESWLRPFPGSVTLIIDGTESATMADGRIFKPYALQKPKYTVISAARKGEEVFYEPPLESSVFSHFLVKGITDRWYGADWNGDGDITARELYDYLYAEMRKYFRNWNDPDSHMPAFHSGDYGNATVFRY